MAIHKKLPVGSLLFNYHEAYYDRNSHRRGMDKYTISFKAIHVFNRRERTNGVLIPIELKPVLDELGIRTIRGYSKQIIAVGCREVTYHSYTSNSPYPTKTQLDEANKRYEELLSSDDNNDNPFDPRINENSFMNDFKEKKMTNKDFLFTLYESPSEFVSKQRHF